MYGLCCHSDRGLLQLPIVKVRASAIINDLSARVTLSQEYTNRDHPLPTECVYVFPVPARAAVSSFEMIKEDGHKVLGMVQEKAEAKATYDQAVQEGKLASLMEQSTPDIFRVTVGNLLPKETVTINLSYVTELTEDEANDSVRFHVPSHISTRYGDPPPVSSATSAKQEPFLILHCAVESVNPISKIACPSHNVETELGPDPSLPNAKDLPFSNYARVSLSADQPSDKDFILTITSAGFDSPRCILERHPSSNSIAMALTMIPKFKLPDIPSQEFVFVIDRSGSMGGWGGQKARIDVAKKALVCALRSLPHKGTFFNIVSFGSSYSALWAAGSREYTQQTLEEATKHTDGMDANMGGTELRSALEFTISKRKTDRPTSIFLLTDGDTYDLQNTAETFKKGVKDALNSAYLRIFVLGIGNSASTAMCESIARLGNGSASSVVDGESFTGKTGRLVKAARAPMITDIKVEWGASGEKDDDDGFELLSDTESEMTMALDTPEPEVKSPQKISLFDETVDPLEKDSTPVPAAEPVKLPPPPPIQQTPYIIRTLSSGTRLYIYSILSPAPTSLPKSVILRGIVNNSTQPEVELEIPVTTSRLPTATSEPPPIHTIAAKKLIQDLGDEAHAYINIEDADKQAKTVKAAIVRLGTTYSLASEHTSFVAVDESDADARRKKRQVMSPPRAEAQVDYTPRLRRGGGGVPAPGAAPALFGSSMASYGAAPPPPSSSSFGAVSFGAPAPKARGMAMRMAAPMMAMAAPMLGRAAAPPPPPPGRMPAPAPSSTPAVFVDSTPMMAYSARSTSKKKSSATLGETEGAFKGGAPPVQKSVGDYDSEADRLDALVREQAFTGSFSATALQICKATQTPTQLLRLLPSAFAGLPNAEALAVTLYVIAFMYQKMKTEKDAWEGVAEKAKEYCEESVGGKFIVENLLATLATHL